MSDSHMVNFSGFSCISRVRVRMVTPTCTIRIHAGISADAMRGYLRMRWSSRIGFPAIALLLLAALEPAAAETKRVVLLHSFGRDFKPWNDHARAIRTELERQSPWRLEISDHCLMTARLGDESPEAPFIEYLRALFAKTPPDIIVSVGAPAARFVQRNRQQFVWQHPHAVDSC